MQVNKIGGQALDEAASSPPILCLILVVRLHLSAFFAYILWRPAFGNIQTRYLKSIKAKAAHHFPIWAGGAIMGLSAAKANKSDAGNGSGLVCRVHGSHLLAVA